MFYLIGDYYGTNMVYEDITDIGNLKKLMQEKLEDYNETPGVVRMDLVLFRDAIEHSKKMFGFIYKPQRTGQKKSTFQFL